MTVIQETPRQFGAHNGTLWQLRTQDGAVLALNHIHANAAYRHQTPLVMVHGMFSNHKFWLSDKGVGLAAHLANQGFDCYLVDRRGMGDSVPFDLKNISLVQFIEQDLAQIQQFVGARHSSAAIWLAHSFGGVQITSALARGFLAAEQIAGLVFFSSQLTVGKWLLNRPLDLLTEIAMAVHKDFPAKKFKMGNENESKTVMRDCVRLVSFAKQKASPNFWTGFDKITMPMLSFGSVGDTVDHYTGCQFLLEKTASRDKQFVLLGRKQGFLQDYSHAGQVVSKDAIAEIWPKVTDWLVAHAQK